MLINSLSPPIRISKSFFSSLSKSSFSTLSKHFFSDLCKSLFSALPISFFSALFVTGIEPLRKKGISELSYCNSKSVSTNLSLSRIHPFLNLNFFSLIDVLIEFISPIRSEFLSIL